MSENPLITIITSTFNSEKTLKRCLDSVNDQTYPYIEHIIIDGNSRDSTKKIIEEYASRSSSRISFWLSEPDSGVYDAWNKALPHIKGDWVCFLGSDDFYVANDTFEKVIEHLISASTDTKIVYGKIMVFDQNYDNVMYVRGCPWTTAKKSFFKGVMIPHPAVFHRAEIFKNYGFFDVTYRIAGDYEMLLRVLKDNEPKYMDIPIVMMQFGGASSKPETLIRSGEEMLSAFKKNDIKNIGCFNFKLRILKLASSIFPKLTARASRIIWDSKLKHMH
jgi:glycosyltransferase involved in cell wall biosynthesis